MNDITTAKKILNSKNYQAQIQVLKDYLSLANEMKDPVLIDQCIGAIQELNREIAETTKGAN